MSQVKQPLDALTGAGQSPAHFDLLDMTYRLRIRAFVGICMPPIFSSLNQHLKMMELRRKGIAPIMFHLDFRSGATPIAFGRGVTNEHTLKLYRSIADANGQPVANGTERLMLVSQSVIRAKARSHGPETLGYDDGSGDIIEAGSAEIMHVITKPVSAPGERQVTTIPEELRVLAEHRWQKPIPSVEAMSVAPAGYTRVDVGAWRERIDVWGMPNTDINQHVNVQEYVMGAENQFSRVLHGAQLAVSKHRISRARLLFRKPFFPGQAYALRSQLYRRGDETQMQAGFHVLENGEPAARPSAFVVFDGVIER